ncbi:MAG: T9SS type A sorting domain-containing protein [Hyphomicrobiales bacterium]
MRKINTSNGRGTSIHKRLILSVFLSGIFAISLNAQNSSKKAGMNSGLPDRKETYYLTPSNLYSAGELRLGEARLYPVWGVSYDANIPENRKTWAIAMIHAHQIFRNVLCWDEYPLSGWFATPTKESACGCDPDIENDPSLPYPIKYYEIDDRDGCYQIEGYNSAYKELSRLYATRFPDGQHDKYISKANFETSAIAKAYYDIGAFRFMEVNKGYKIYEFLNECPDELAAVKVISAAYNRGWWSQLLTDIFVNKRSEAIKSNDILDFFGSEGVAKDHAAQITQYVNVMTDQAYRLKPELLAVNPETRQPYNFFKGYYDEKISWNDMSDYLNKIFPLYPEVDKAQVTSRIKKVFDGINNGEPVSFRFELGQVIDEMMLSLPVDDPTKGIVEWYGNNFPADGQVPDCTKPLGLEDTPEAIGSFKIDGLSPNPAQDYVDVHFSLPTPQSVKIVVTDNYGRQMQVIESKKYPGGRSMVSLDTKSLTPGVYMIQLQNSYTSRTKKLVVYK